MRWVEVGDTDICYQDVGEGQPLVFLHGMSSCSEAWYQQLDAFQDRFRCIAYDSVNHGHSSNSPRDEPEPDRADELEGFLNALGIDRPILAGNSMGAGTLLRWACRNPDRAAALIPSGAGVGRRDAPAGGGAGGGGGRAAGARRGLDPETIWLPFGDSLTEGLKERNPRLYERYYRIRSTATRIEALRHPRPRTARDPDAESLEDRVQKIASPMMVIVGSIDRAVPRAQRLHEVVPHSEYRVIEGAPHNVYYEAAKEYNQIVADFLTRTLG